jgi:hypothetical protein
MNELQLPPAPPLPDEVRDRVLRTVLAGTQAPRRRFAPLVAAAVAVATTVAVTAAVTMTGGGGSAAQQESAAPQDDPAVAEALSRCAAAVTGSESRGNYPPPVEWRITDVLPMPNDTTEEDDPGIALVINGSFACHPDRYVVWVSTVGGAPAGAIQVAQLTGFEFVLFNQQRLAVEVGFDDGRTQSSTAPVQIISISPWVVGGPVRRIVVPGSYDGPAPNPENVGITVQDRPIPEPGPPPQEIQEAEEVERQMAEQSVRLTSCLARWLLPVEERTGTPHETVLTQEAYEGTPAALVGRVSGERAAFCYDGGPGGPVGADGALVPDPPVATGMVTSLRRDGLVVALVQVAPDVERIEIATAPQPGTTGSGTTCTVQNGFALCMLRAEGPVDVRIFTGGTGTTMPVP